MRVEVSDEDDGNHLLSNLHQFPTVTHLEILHLVERRRLWSTGLSAVHVNLLGSVAFVEGAQLWKRDKRLRAVATEVGVPVVAGLVTTPAGGCPAARRDLRGVDAGAPADSDDRQVRRFEYQFGAGARSFAARARMSFA
jgi:hypothetical protein